MLTKTSEEVVYSVGTGMRRGFSAEVDPNNYEIKIIESMRVKNHGSEVVHEHLRSIEIHNYYTNRDGNKVDDCRRISVIGKGFWIPDNKLPVEVERKDKSTRENVIVKTGEIQCIYYLPEEYRNASLTMNDVRDIAEVKLVIFRRPTKTKQHKFVGK